MWDYDYSYDVYLYMLSLCLITMINFSKFKFIPNKSSKESLQRGDGSILIPLDAVPKNDKGIPESVIPVCDYQDRKVNFDGRAEIYLPDAMSKMTHAGWSYWESEETEVFNVTPAINLIVLSPLFDESQYPGA